MDRERCYNRVNYCFYSRWPGARRMHWKWRSIQGASLVSKLIIALFFLRNGLPKIFKLLGITWKSSVNLTPLTQNVNLTCLSTWISVWATPWMVIFLFEIFSIHFDGSFVRNWLFKTDKLAPLSSKNSVGIWPHLARSIVCHLPVVRQCLHFVESVDIWSLNFVSIISISPSMVVTFTQSWYHNTSHCIDWSLGFPFLLRLLRCLFLPLRLLFLSLLEVVSFEIELSALLVLSLSFTRLILISEFRYWSQFPLRLEGDIVILPLECLFCHLLFLLREASFCVRGLPRFVETGDTGYCWNVTCGAADLQALA